MTNSSVFHEILPCAESDGFYNICDCAESEGPIPGRIISTISTRIFSEEDLLMWVETFEEKSFVTWRNNLTNPNVGTRTVFDVIYTL